MRREHMLLIADHSGTLKIGQRAISLLRNDRTPPDTLTLDVGEHTSVALITVNLPAPEGEVSLTQRAHSLLLKYLTDDARSNAIENGSIALRKGCSHAGLVAELTKASHEADCVSPNPRKG